MSLENPNLPHVGQWVDYFPSDTERNAALVVEVHEAADIGDRPAVNLQVFHPGGDIEFEENIAPVDPHPVDGAPDLAGHWGFAHEFFLIVDETKPSYKGTESNSHVGEYGNTRLF